jgi:hypothetical protein
MKLADGRQPFSGLIGAVPNFLLNFFGQGSVTEHFFGLIHMLAPKRQL